jgi:precorrin-6A/cobalt-precorrin-6A reductase
MKRLLLLGGVTDALAIARTLGPQHIYSLAGVGRVPTDLICQVRVGGYGGAEGLAQFISEHGIDLLVDATHPYAAQISQNAARAAELAHVPCWALRRPGWQAGPDDDWREVADWTELVQALQPFQRPLFTLGREPLQHLEEIPAHQFWTLRALENTLRDVPQHERCEVIGARGPFRVEDERSLFVQLAIDVLISKNSGGDATEAKLEVARELKVPVLILKRPVLPEVDREFASRQALLEALGLTVGAAEGCESGTPDSPPLSKR